MKHLFFLASILLSFPLMAQEIVHSLIPGKNPETVFNNYVETLRQNDVHITLPSKYSPSSTRGNSDVRTSIGFGAKNINMDCIPTNIGAIIEDDNCQVAVCFPKIQSWFPGVPEYNISNILGGKGIEADLRMANDDMHLDVRPLIRVIADEDISPYANADTVVMYDFKMFNHPFMESYTLGTGIYLRKKDHPSILLRLMFNPRSVKEKDKYIREVLDNIRFGDNPSDTFVELERQAAGKSDLSFPTKYRTFTGILPDINDETLDEINRVRAWCEAHGIKQLPQLDDEVIEALNRHRKFRDTSKAQADSILTADTPDDKKILYPNMCDSHPHFPGKDVADGNKKYWSWLYDNIRYPKKAADKGIGGMVDVNFIVCADGSIKDISISNSSHSADESLKQEAIRLIKSMPRWVPATYKGKSVNAYASCLVNFTRPEKKIQSANTETSAVHPNEDPVYDMKSIPVAPKFNGGTNGIAEWIQEHIQYPAQAAKAKVEGRVIVEFIIAKDGTVTNPRVVRGINDALNTEAIRVIKTLPRWTPGYSHGKPVQTRYTFPVTFRLAKAK